MTAGESRVPGRLWFVHLPRVAGRFSRNAAFALADGHFLTALHGRAAVWLSPAAALLGVLCGATSLGYETVYTESLAIMVLAAALGFVSAGLGAAFVAGFAVSDFLVAHPVWTAAPPSPDGPLAEGLAASLLLVRVPLLVTYLLLGILALGLPQVARVLVSDLPGLHRLPSPLAFAVVAVTTAVSGAVLVSLWTQTAAVLVRPVFTWVGDQPTVEAVATLQASGAWVARAAVAAGLGRSALLWWIERSERRSATVRQTEVALGAPHGPARPLAELLPPWLRAVSTAALTTLLLAGMLSPWWLAGIVFPAVLAGRLLRQLRADGWLHRWRVLTARVPTLARLGVGFLIVQTLGAAVERYALDSQTFVPVALFVVAAVLILAALLPGDPAPRTAAAT